MTLNAFSATFLLLAGAAGCHNEAPGQSERLRSLYGSYKEGAIDECRLNGRLVYTASQNAYDAETIIFDSTGKQIGNCNYAWGKPNAMCKELQSCETIYRCKGHITGQEPVDKYGLGKLD